MVKHGLHRRKELIRGLDETSDINPTIISRPANELFQCLLDAFKANVTGKNIWPAIKIYLHDIPFGITEAQGRDRKLTTPVTFCRVSIGRPIASPVPCAGLFAGAMRRTDYPAHISPFGSKINWPILSEYGAITGTPGAR